MEMGKTMDDDAIPVALILGRDAATVTMLRFLLDDLACAVHAVADARAALAILPRHAVALLLVVADAADEVAEALGTLRRMGLRCPTLLLTRSSDLTLRRRAFALGTRDVVGLPAGACDLQARLRAALGDACPARSPRPPSPTPGIVRAGQWTLDPTRGVVSDGQGWTTRLTRRETALLLALMQAPERVVARDELLERVWSPHYAGTANTLEVCVSRLRAKLAGAPPPGGEVRAVRGQGYAWSAPLVADPLPAVRSRAVRARKLSPARSA